MNFSLKNPPYSAQIPLMNTSQPNEILPKYIFDRPEIRSVFIIIYSVVFILAFFGNLTVLLVILRKKTKQITKLCLTNLAIADFCVGIFCVYQNLTQYLIQSWIFGDYLCKMYHFITSLSHTASVLILIVVCIERYLAILYPMRCRQSLTNGRLKAILIFVWIASGIYASPRLIYTGVIQVPRFDRVDAKYEMICTGKRNVYNSKMFDLVNSFVLFLLPLLIMSVLYAKIGHHLWGQGRMAPSNNQQQGQNDLSIRYSVTGNTGSIPADYGDATIDEEISMGPCCIHGEASSSSQDYYDSGAYNGYSLAEYGIAPLEPSSPWRLSRSRLGSRQSSGSIRSNTKKKNQIKRFLSTSTGNLRNVAITSPPPKSDFSEVPIKFYLIKHTMSSRGDAAGRPREGENLNLSSAVRYRNENVRIFRTVKGNKKKATLKSRKQVTWMLVVLVLAFAVCNLPFHLRKFMLYYKGPLFDMDSVWSTLVLPLTQLSMYTNSAINPIIYFFMSSYFRTRLRSVFHDCL